MTHLRQLPMLQFFSHTHFHSSHCSEVSFLFHFHCWRPFSHSTTVLQKWKNNVIRNCWISARGALKLHPFGISKSRENWDTNAKVVWFYLSSSTYPVIVLPISNLFYCLTIVQFLIQMPSEVSHACWKGASKIAL